MKKKAELIGQIVEQFKNRNTPVRTWISDITTDNLAIVIAKYYSAIVGQVYNQESIAERCSIIAKYLTQTDKIGLALIGPPGTGKSSFLRAISRSLIHFGKPAFCFETSIIKELITNHPEDWDSYWKREEENLVHFCKSRVLDCIDRWEYKRIALFGLAPMPLLVRLGTMLNNKHNVVVYQKQRSGGWKWPKTDDTIDYIIHRPCKEDGVPVLVLSLSFSIIERVKKENAGASIWEITINNPNPDFLQSEKMLYDFGRKIEMILDEISKTSSHQAINLYLAAPAACCIEFGRVWMQKANSPIKIFDYDIKFSKTDKLAITIKNKEND